MRGLALAAALGAALASGCYTFEIEGDGLKTPQSAHGAETVHGSLWGFTWADRDIEKSSQGLGLLRVEYHTNVFFVLATVISLGLYSPHTVEWWCQAPAPGDDDGPLFGGDGR
jgi:hypothetical protein